MPKRKTRPAGSLANLYFNEGASERNERKDAQLCAQVADAVGLALADAHDPAMACLWVMRVEPAPHVGRLRVYVQAEPDADLLSLRTKLQARERHLRREVGEAIHRKKVPSLTFVVVSRAEEDVAW